jgi:hypothetical protein
VLGSVFTAMKPDCVTAEARLKPRRRNASGDFYVYGIRFKSEHTPEEFAKAYAAMNIRDDG